MVPVSGVREELRVGLTGEVQVGDRGWIEPLDVAVFVRVGTGWFPFPIVGEANVHDHMSAATLDHDRLRSPEQSCVCLNATAAAGGARRPSDVVQAWLGASAERTDNVACSCSGVRHFKGIVEG